jgi:copper chaperone CopZ
MSCASCVQRIESAIGNAEGVSESIANFATRKATVTGSVLAEEIHKIIEEPDYSIVKDEAHAVSEESSSPSWKRPALKLSLKGISLSQAIIEERSSGT